MTDHFQVKTGKIFTTIEKIIDKTGNIGYTKNTKGATGRRFPRNVYEEVTACLEAGRLYSNTKLCPQPSHPKPYHITLIHNNPNPHM